MTQRPFCLGLTGSIGMGKSTTAAMFAQAGVPVWDADAAVHRLYGPGGAAVGPIGDLFPEVIVDGAVSRERLRTRVQADPDVLPRLEEVVHPLLAKDRADFVAQYTDEGAALVVFDIPLLFETGLDSEMDASLVVSAPPEIQRARVLERPGMDEAQLDAMLARQMPDDDKRARATYVIETRTPEQTRREVIALIDRIRRGSDA